MQCNPFSRNASRAVRRYTVGIALTMSGYVLAVLGTSSYVGHHHPRGSAVYLLSALPSICIVAMLGVVIIYLRDEKDEYLRMVVVRSLLGATFILLAVSAYVDFLRSFGNFSGLPPFSEFVAFWILFGFGQAVQSLGNRSNE